MLTATLGLFTAAAGENGAGIEVRDLEGETALHQTPRFGHEARDQYRETAIYQTTKLEYEAVVQLPLEKGADVENESL
jgi:ankyrin repeat protein